MHNLNDNRLGSYTVKCICFHLISKTYLEGHMICLKCPESNNMIASLPEVVELIFFDGEVDHCQYIRH